MPRARLRHADVWPAAALAAVGTALFLYEWINPTGTPVFGVSAGTLPLANAGILVFLSIVLLAQSLIASGARTLPPDEPSWPAWQAYALGLISIVYVILMPWLGYIAASALFVGALAWLFGNRRPLLILGLMIATPFALSFFFEKAMVVYLPAPRIFE